MNNIKYAGEFDIVLEQKNGKTVTPACSSMTWL